MAGFARVRNIIEAYDAQLRRKEIDKQRAEIERNKPKKKGKK